jgi:hypothetical protein
MSKRTFLNDIYSLDRDAVITVSENGVFIRGKNEKSPKATILTGKERENALKMLADLEKQTYD